MMERRVTVRLKTGLQARPAALFVQEANRYKSEIYVEKDGKRINAKSIMGVMSLAVASGSEIILAAEGADAEKALDALASLVSQENYTPR
ncbi:catabolite repression HPr-like protein [[Clostridium] ultunense Esp]|uniref:HPr family phosphocarrier protein n=1 Tax=Thermicanus aegyptius TaxID=94009 RepID=UPI0002B6EE51|nr:HPr family phosphocarrier protein [Thermicanus aegyptius]CCQ97996.1 catabolite repression HPr-like protein [[Clostridium] ultunense Esp]